METPVFLAPADAGDLANQRLTTGIVVTCLSLATISFVLRIYARVVTHAKLWYDDYWMFVVMTLCIAMSTCDFIGLAYGSGRHITELSPSTIVAFMKNLYVYMLTWACGVFAVKIGILLFYWRVFHTRGFRIAAVIVGALSTGIFLSNFFSFTFQCLPVSKFWDAEEPGACFDQNSFYLASAIINVFGDVAVLFLPLPVVWKLNTSKNKKWSLSFLFLLGAFVCVASIFRIIAVNQIDPHDFTFTNVGGGLWSTVEVEIGFICANLPAIRPLVFKLLKIKGSSNNRSAGTGPTGGRYGYGNHYGKGKDGVGTCSNCGGTCIRCRGTAAGHMRSANDDLESNNGSDEIELTKSSTMERSLSRHSPAAGSIGGGIRVRTDVEQTVDDWHEPAKPTAEQGQQKIRSAKSVYGNKIDSFVVIQRASLADA